MAKANDFSELSQLIKTERKAQKKARKLEEILVDGSAARERERATERETNSDGVRFADLFRPWTELKPPSDDEKALFLKSVADATPLAKVDRKVHPPKVQHAYPKHRRDDELAALEASQLAMNPSPMSWDIGADIEDEQSYLRAGVNPDLLRKLRRGHWSIQAELDLHHHNQDEAHDALAEFVRTSRVADWRCVRIIHGKGLSSHMKIPVLRNKVRRWLQQKDEVLAYCEPRPNGGGSGAVLVLLRGAK